MLTTLQKKEKGNPVLDNKLDLVHWTNQVLGPIR